MQIRVWAGVVLAVAALSACSSGGSSSSGGQTVTQVHCYATGIDPNHQYPSFSIEVLGASDCTAIANAAQYSVGNLTGMKVTPSTSRVKGSMICSGVVGDYPVYVYDSLDDPGLCTDMGLPAVP